MEVNTITKEITKSSFRVGIFHNSRNEWAFIFNLIVYRYLKTFIIMANYQIKFIDLDSGEDTLQVFKNDKEVLNLKNDFIRICIEKGQDYPIIFDMDKSTAIKFAKTLRTEINKITESEVKNEA